jgi:hypothetical protein
VETLWKVVAVPRPAAEPLKTPTDAEILDYFGIPRGGRAKNDVFRPAVVDSQTLMA